MGEHGWKVQITVESRDSALPTFRVKYTITRTGEQFDYPIYLRTTVPPYGGLKWWFICPFACGRRVRKLYLPPGAKCYECRHCHNLSYVSRNDGKYGALFKAQAIRMRLGGSPSIYDPFPPKPKGMWSKTYRRLLEQEALHCASHIQKKPDLIIRKSAPPDAPGCGRVPLFARYILGSGEAIQAKNDRS